MAKPIGCLAWNPDREYSEKAWRAFAIRDRLNEKTLGKRWELKAIPLLLTRLFRSSSSAKASPAK